MILPFVTIGSKLLFCSLADRHRAYRSFFVGFLISALIGYGSFAVLPFLIERPPENTDTNKLTFGLICLMTSVATISMSVISCLSDAFAVNSAKKYNTSYGSIRLWGTIGWGVSALALTFLSQIEQLPLLVPGLIMTIILISIDILAAVLWPRRDDFKLDKSASDMGVEDVVSVLAQQNSQTKPPGPIELKEMRGEAQAPTSYGATSKQPSSLVVEFASPHQYVDISSVKMQWILFKEVAGRRLSIFRYMSLFTISGALIALQWSWFFLYLKEIYTEKNVSYISSISMIGQSMLGELPFFLISQRVIKLLGRSHTLSVSIASIGVRYLLYEYLLTNASMYFVLVTESLQGPNFGLFYVVMTEVGLDYSDCEEAIVSTVRRGIVANNPEQIDKLRQALRATMQSLMSACYEGLGVGIGSILSGPVIDNYGFSTLWFYAALIAFALGLFNFLIDVFGITLLADRRPTDTLRA